MISLHPEGASTPIDTETAVADEERYRADGRPWVLTNMIMSADGATAIDGVSGALGGPADAEMFAALRAASDAIVVGATTAEQERYRPPSPGPEASRRRRLGRIGSERPTVVIVTSSLSIGHDVPLLAASDYRPLVATVSDAPADRRRALDPLADVVECGTRRVDLEALLIELGRRGAATVLLEGGPRLNGQFIAQDLIDEWNVTLSPILAAGSSQRPAQGDATAQPPVGMRLTRVWEADDLLFCRWVRADR